MTAPVRPIDRRQSRTSHRLQLPRETDPAAVLTMVRNLRPEAGARTPTA